MQQGHVESPTIEPSQLVPQKVALANGRVTSGYILDHCFSLLETLWATMKEMVKYIKIDEFCYYVCPLKAIGRKCKKKCEDSANNMWYYPKC